MESGRHRLLGLSVVAGITLVYLAFDRRARRKVLRWAKVLWDGDEEGEIDASKSVMLFTSP